MTITILLTTIGGDAGPFELYSDVDSYSTPFDTATVIELGNGYTTALAPEGSTIIRVKSVGPPNSRCSNSTDFTIEFLGTTSTTSTTTSSTTAAPTTTTTSTFEGTTTTSTTELFTRSFGYISTVSDLTGDCGASATLLVYLEPQNGKDTLTTGDIIYSSITGPSVFSGDGNFYKIISGTVAFTAPVNGVGQVLSPINICPS